MEACPQKGLWDPANDPVLCFLAHEMSDLPCNTLLLWWLILSRSPKWLPDRGVEPSGICAPNKPFSEDNCLGYFVIIIWRELIHSRWKTFNSSKVYYFITSTLEMPAAYSSKYWFPSQPAMGWTGVELGWAWLTAAPSCVLELGLLHMSRISLRAVAAWDVCWQADVQEVRHMAEAKLHPWCVPRMLMSHWPIVWTNPRSRDRILCQSWSQSREMHGRGGKSWEAELNSTTFYVRILSKIQGTLNVLISELMMLRGIKKNYLSGRPAL